MPPWSRSGGLRAGKMGRLYAKVRQGGGKTEVGATHNTGTGRPNKNGRRDACR